MTKRIVPVELLEESYRFVNMVRALGDERCSSALEHMDKIRAVIDSPEVDTIPASFLQVCKEEAERSALTSNPMKYEFMRSHGMSSLDEVHEWMIRTQDKFARAVVAQQCTKK